MSSQGGARLIQLHKIIVPALRPRQVAVYRESMSSIAHMLLDRIADPGPPTWWPATPAYPGLVMSPLMGVPFSDTVELTSGPPPSTRWATTPGTTTVFPRSRRPGRRWRTTSQAIAERRTHPHSDIISDLTEGADADPEMSDDDLLNLAMAVVNASIETSGRSWPRPSRHCS